MFVRIITNAVHTHAHTYQAGWTALRLAAQEGHEDIVELLLVAMADLELQTKVISVWTRPSVCSMHTQGKN